MAEVHRLPDMEEVEREASEWIARLNADDVTDEDRANFEAWRKAHPRRARAYDEMLGTWRQLTDAGQLVRAVKLGQDLEASAQNAIRQALPARTPDAGTVDNPTTRRVFLAAAALTAVAIGISFLFLDREPRTLFQTAIGEHATIELPDGSSLELNSNSLARVDYTEHARIIRLERGEAYFDVEHDMQRPFWVVARNSWVRAVGTAFNVHIRSTGVRVIVSEGTVKVAASAPSSARLPSDLELTRASVSVLEAGQQVDVRGTATEIRSLPLTELMRTASWRTGTVYFENQRLADVITELGRYTTLNVVVDDDDLRDLQVGGTFQSNPQGTEALLTMLEDGFGLQIRREGDTAYISDARTPH